MDILLKNKELKNNNKILFYTGNMFFNWNETYSKNNALGGSEKAIIYLSQKLKKNYDIYISGDVEEETIDNITYINKNNLQNLLDNNSFNSVIVSRYICFLKYFKNIRCYNFFLYSHDVRGFISTFFQSDIQIFDEFKNQIDKIISLTDWHKETILKNYNLSNNNFISIINNGINTKEFLYDTSKKIKNKFIWSSRIERGLDNLLNLWPSIIDKLPDASLDICTYSEDGIENYPHLLEIIQSYDSINFIGKLQSKDLYKLMSVSEYWLYTTNFCETSCITAMEMLMSEVICLYYPLAGLCYTLGDYGIKINTGNEIDTILNLTPNQKEYIKKRGKEYAINCDWDLRSKDWIKIINHKSDNYSKYIISLTTIPSRINYIENTLNSLLEQTIKPEKIILNIPKIYNFRRSLQGKPVG